MAGAGPDEQHHEPPQRDGTGFDMEGLGRAAIMLGGGALAWYGLRRRGALGIGLTALGGILASAGMARPLAETPAEPGQGGAT